MAREVILINTNVLKPPVSPVGLEYVAEALVKAGVPVRAIDLPFERDWRASLHKVLKSTEVLFVGVSVRNTDDCSFISGKSFLPWIRDVVGEVKKHTDAPVFLGGVGFSIMPEVVVQATGADGGIEYDGEDAIVALVKALASGTDYESIPNVVYRQGDKIIRNPRQNVDLSRIPARRRNVFNNKLYEVQGAMVGIETKRGCGQKCIYCADPVAKGTRTRLRPPHLVAQEFSNLMTQGVTYFHLCDHEFNLPISHAKEVCQALIGSGLGSKTHWYTYCAPVPFDRELALLMKSAGCKGINFGVDSLDDGMLKRLGRNYTSDEVRRLAEFLNSEGINYLFDFLVGGPGETPETVSTTIERVKQYNLKGAGMAVGVRVYPGTRLGRHLETGKVKDGLHSTEPGNPASPLFYLSPALGENVTGIIRELVDDDPRFMVLAAPGEKGSYNYAGDDLLSRLIKEGARGAYWDIIRKYQTSISNNQVPTPFPPLD
ncbi:MAG: radical SAM protein [Dehalococcoidia bacterium]|nr:radical SAM protein [Dehalococcoidia bacterium]